MAVYPLREILFWIAVTLSPPDAAQILVKGPELTVAWTRQDSGWSCSADRSLWRAEDGAVKIDYRAAEQKTPLTVGVSEFVQGVKQNDWQQSASLKLATGVSLSKNDDTFVFTKEPGTAGEKGYSIQYRRKAAAEVLHSATQEQAIRSLLDAKPSPPGLIRSRVLCEQALALVAEAERDRRKADPQSALDAAKLASVVQVVEKLEEKAPELLLVTPEQETQFAAGKFDDARNKEAIAKTAKIFNDFGVQLPSVVQYVLKEARNDRLSGARLEAGRRMLNPTLAELMEKISGEANPPAAANGTLPLPPGAPRPRDGATPSEVAESTIYLARGSLPVFQGQPVAVEKLAAQLEAAKVAKNRHIVIQAAADVPYGDLVSVLEHLRKNGYTQLSFKADAVTRAEPSAERVSYELTSIVAQLLAKMIVSEMERFEAASDGFEKPEFAVRALDELQKALPRAFMLSPEEDLRLAAGRTDDESNRKLVRESVATLKKHKVDLPKLSQYLVEQAEAGKLQGKELEAATRILAAHAADQLPADSTTPTKSSSSDLALPSEAPKGLEGLRLTKSQAEKINQWLTQHGQSPNPAKYAKFMESILRDDQKPAFKKILETGGQ